jgi:hypothetical protein
MRTFEDIPPPPVFSSLLTAFVCRRNTFKRRNTQALRFDAVTLVGHLLTVGRVAGSARLPKACVCRLRFLNIVRFGGSADCRRALLGCFRSVECILGLELRPE